MKEHVKCDVERPRHRPWRATPAAQSFEVHAVSVTSARVVIVDALPLTGSGKVQKFALRDAALAGELFRLER